jgi:hypothetical protein
VRAAYGALILGLAGGLWLAGQALSITTGPVPTTVADALGLDRVEVDIDARRSEAVAVLVARCMAAHGLPWEPRIEPPAAVPDPDLEPIAWAERWGFGISTLVGRHMAEAPHDPERVSIETLPREDRDGYRAALSGTGPTDVGCQRAATDAVYGLRDRLLAPLKPGLTDLDGRIAADGAARQAVEAWRRCVAPIADGRTPERRTFATTLVQGFVTRSAMLGLGPPGATGRLALQVEERRVAATLARCEAAFVKARADVAGPYEAAFVAQHGAELERIGAAIRDAEAALPTMPP